MRVAVAIGCVAGLAVTMGEGQVISEMKSLYDAHKWVELSDRLGDTKGRPFYRGAIGMTFNQDPVRTEQMLLSVIPSAPDSAEAYDAYEWLSHLYFYRGQYQSLVSIMEKRWAAFPNKKERDDEQRAIAGFHGLPNQILEKIALSMLHDEDGCIFVPLSIDGSPQRIFSIPERGCPV